MSTVAVDCARILAVDDEPMMLDVYRRVLSSAVPHGPGDQHALDELEARLFPDSVETTDRDQFGLQCCSQAEEAVEAVRRAVAEGRPFAVAVFDVRMPPGPDGIWAAEQARAIDPDLEIVIATAYSDVSPDEIARRVPPAEQLFYVQKPLAPEAMRRLATSLTAKWKAGQAAQRAQAELQEANEALTREIEERTETEQALRRSEGLLGSILEAAPSGVGIVRDRVIQWVNERLEEMTGYEKAELVGHNARLLYVDDDQFDQVGAAYAQLEGSRTASIEVRWRRKDGTTIDVLLMASYLDPTDPSAGVAFTATDISDRKRAEEALRDSECRYRALFENLNDAAFLADHETGTIVETNRRGQQLLKRPRSEIIGMHQSEIHPPEKADEYRRRFREHANVTHLAPHEGQVVASEGTIIPVMVSDTTVSVNGQTFVLGLFQDISERKQAEEALRRNESFLTSVFHGIQNGISVLDRNLNIVRVNKWHEEAYADAMPVVGKKCYVVYQRRTSPCPWCPAVRAIETATLQTEVVPYPCADKPQRWMELSAFPIKDNGGRVTGVIEHVQDITERKQAEETLARSERRYREAIEGAGGVPYLHRFDSDSYEFVGTGIEGLLGISADEFRPEIIGEMAQEVIIADPNAPEDIEEYDRAYRRGEVPSYLVDFRIEGWGDDSRWISDRATQVRDEKTGRIIGSLGILQDITDRKRAEERQNAITDGLHAVVEAADELIACPDLDSLYRRAVQLGRVKLGLERCSLFLIDGDCMQGTYGTDLHGDTTDERAYRGPCADCCSPLPPPRSGGRRWRALGGPHQEWDGERYREGREGWTVLTPVQHASGMVGLFFNDAAITDAPIDETKQDILAIYCSMLAGIIERKQAEEAVRDSEERFRALIENASDVVITVDETGTITFTSPSAGRLLGYSPGEAIGRSAFDFVHPDDQAIAREAFERAVRDGDTRQLVEFRVCAKDGSWRYVQAVASVPGEDTPISGIIINYRDVTEWRQLAEHLQQTSKLQSIGTLAGGVAHDFNNILTGIIGYADMLQTEGAVIGEHTRDLDKIRHLADRAAGLTRQLLLFSRQQPIEPVILNPNDLVENLSKMLRRIIGEDIELELVLSPDLGNVRADPGQVEQVLMNLAVNARDAMPEGGRLTIETCNLSLDEAYVDHHVGLEPGSYATITVSDTGCGMDTETRQRVFEPFFTTKEVGKGTGLGLATVYGIVQQHEGGVWVYSEPGQGSTFKVYLPRVDERARDAEARIDESAPQGNETVLLVEDEDTVREIAQQALEKRGYRVFAAATPAEAREVFEQHKSEIALLLTDVVMPGKTGPGLHEWLVAQKPSLQVLFMSGYTEHAAVSGDLIGGGAPFLQKPFTPTTLAQKVRQVLDR